MVGLFRRDFLKGLAAAAFVLPGCATLSSRPCELSLEEIRAKTGYPELSISALEGKLTIDVGNRNEIGDFKRVLYDLYERVEVKSPRGAILFLDPNRKVTSGVLGIRYVNHQGIIRDLVFVNPEQYKTLQESEISLPVHKMGTFSGYEVFDTVLNVFEDVTIKDGSQLLKIIQKDPYRLLPPCYRGHTDATKRFFENEREILDPAYVGIGGQHFRLYTDDPQDLKKVRRILSRLASAKANKSFAEVMGSLSVYDDKISGGGIDGSGIATPLESLLTAKTVDCDGIAKIYQHILNEAGFPTSLVLKPFIHSGKMYYHVWTETYVADAVVALNVANDSKPVHAIIMPHSRALLDCQFTELPPSIVTQFEIKQAPL
ncbi:MAG TPA: twin-arginine translocation signal domain-containing protein [Candidatus Nanoarchaeia archaeon]|nr:twin-arginine translocation signal domain-containing protein [Candidatus Nanoarchaeia archaeon]